MNDMYLVCKFQFVSVGIGRSVMTMASFKLDNIADSLFIRVRFMLNQV